MRKYGIMVALLMVWCAMGHAADKRMSMISKPCLAIGHSNECWKYNSFVKDFLRDKPFYATTEEGHITGIWTCFSPQNMKDKFIAYFHQQQHAAKTSAPSTLEGYSDNQNTRWSKRRYIAGILTAVSIVGSAWWVAKHYEILPYTLAISSIAAAIACGVYCQRKRGIYNNRTGEGKLKEVSRVQYNKQEVDTVLKSVLHSYFVLNVPVAGVMPQLYQSSGMLRVQEPQYGYRLRVQESWLRSFTIAKFKENYPDIIFLSE